MSLFSDLCHLCKSVASLFPKLPSLTVGLLTLKLKLRPHTHTPIALGRAGAEGELA
jgi:hypothetical protein